MAQSAGVIDCNIGLNCIDFAVFAGHKTLYGSSVLLLPLSKSFNRLFLYPF